MYRRFSCGDGTEYVQGITIFFLSIHRQDVLVIGQIYRFFIIFPIYPAGCRRGPGSAYCKTSLPGGLPRSGMIPRPGKSVRHLPGTFPAPSRDPIRQPSAYPAPFPETTGPAAFPADGAGKAFTACRAVARCRAVRPSCGSPDHLHG